MEACMRTAIAVIDIGKTNKKVHIYSEELELVDSRSKTFEPIVRDGVSFEATSELYEWLLDTLSDLAARYPIEVISITTHGASFACVDEAGELAVPVVDYTYEPGGSFHDEFYELAGERDELQRTTATLELKALVNPGKGIFFLKKTYPQQFARTRHILMYTQYFAFKLTGVVTSDPTYLGCHTYLFDPASLSYSAVADRLGVRELLPARLQNPGEVAGRILPEVAARTGLSPLVNVLVGIHDSNASLIPYLIKKHDEDLIVNSTGTWCVTMHPATEVSFSEDEIGKAIFFNMSAFREPVKTSILVGGLEFETYTRLLREHYGMEGFPEFNPRLYRDIVSSRSEFILPTVVPGTGQYPQSAARIVDHGETFTLDEVRSGSRAPALFSDVSRAYAALNLSLALQTSTALRRVGLREGGAVYTEGGFRGNEDYNRILATLHPDSAFYLSGMPEATSFGAALLGLASLQDVPVASLRDTFELEQEPVRPVELPGLKEYAGAFYRQLEDSARE
jgi:sugar (pentulose or hexulose) kinase